MTRRIIAQLVAFLAVVAGTLVLATGSASAATVHCYQWPQGYAAAIWYGPDGLLHTQQIMVTTGGPCRDVNVRAVTANGKPTCRMMRVRWDSDTSIATGPWTRVCTGWRVLWSNAQEGRVFEIEIQGSPALSREVS